MVFGLSKESEEAPELWQDREIRFDCKAGELECRPGEEVISVLDRVEDTKGNNGIAGELRVTNLRLIWVNPNKKAENISIGLNCVVTLSSTTLDSRLKGNNTSAISILTNRDKQRFQFLFTPITEDTAHVLRFLKRIRNGYQSTPLCRDLKLRGSIFINSDLSKLPQEETVSVTDGVFNLSNEQGNLGKMFVTNLRVVWAADSDMAFNVSIPYVQISVFKIRDSSYGEVLVIETTKSSGGYVLGFRTEPAGKQQDLFKDIDGPWQASKASPVLGVKPIEPYMGEKEPDVQEVRVQEVRVQEGHVDLSPEAATDDAHISVEH